MPEGTVFNGIVAALLTIATLTFLPYGTVVWWVAAGILAFVWYAIISESYRRVE